MASVRFTTKMGLPRHSGRGPRISPGRSLLTSARTGAPRALAFALGCQDARKGTAAPTTPAPPTTEVAPIKKRRRARFTSPLLTKSLPGQFGQVCRDEIGRVFGRFRLERLPAPAGADSITAIPSLGQPISIFCGKARVFS